MMLNAISLKEACCSKKKKLKLCIWNQITQTKRKPLCSHNSLKYFLHVKSLLCPSPLS